ncbi:sodium:alanine symporter family protein [Lentibacillus sp. CBA3610]|nr:sodium:alanine symporter family protein [Lentibacillus sp. CBA3610]
MFVNWVEFIVQDVLWGTPLIITILTVGVFLSLKTDFFQIRRLPLIFRESTRDIKRSKDKQKGGGVLSPFEAVSLSIGATVGVGNIGGVAAAIALGGPGAVFWMWIAGLVGKIIKMTEVSLAVHYRSRDKNGEAYGGPTYYIRKGLYEERNHKVLYKILNFIFIFGFGTGFVLTVQNYTVSEAVATTFSMNHVLVSLIYTVLLYIMISGGLSGLGKIAVKVVPFMIVFYILGGLYILAININVLPDAFALIVNSAFNGTSAAGGFAGAAVAVAIKTGMSRAVFTNEAGWGSSAMIHATAKTDHPIRQGMLGAFEVFVDTFVICSITSLVIIVTGAWTTGLDGAELTLAAFETGVGTVGRMIIAVGVLLFGLTTSSGIYAQIEVILRYVLGESKWKKRILTVYKWTYPIPGFILVLIAVSIGMPGTMVWLFADMTTALPIFANVITILILSPKFFALLKDFKARHLQKGEVDPDFKVFYDNKENRIVTEEKKDA